MHPALPPSRNNYSCRPYPDQSGAGNGKEDNARGYARRIFLASGLQVPSAMVVSSVTRCEIKGLLHTFQSDNNSQRCGKRSKKGRVSCFSVVRAIRNSSETVDLIIVYPDVPRRLRYWTCVSPCRANTDSWSESRGSLSLELTQCSASSQTCSSPRHGQYSRVAIAICRGHASSNTGKAFTTRTSGTAYCLLNCSTLAGRDTRTAAGVSVW